MSVLDNSMAMDEDMSPFSTQSSRRPAIDVVRWQGPQPSCPALGALLSEAARLTAKPPKFDNQPPWGSLQASSSTTVSSGSVSRYDASTSKKSGPKVLLARQPTAVSLQESSTVIPFFNGTPADLYSYIDGVREKADENTRQNILSRKKVAKQAPSREQSREGRHSSTTSKISRDLSGKVEKEQRHGKAPIVGHRSLPELGTPAVRLDRQSSLSMEVNGSFEMAMEVDVSSPVGPSRPARISTSDARAPPSHMPPPPVPIQNRSNSLLNNTSHPSRDEFTISRPLASSTPPPIKVHPLLSQAVPPQTRSQLKTHSRPTDLSPPTIPPRPSQSSRPPVLGMRRVTPYSTLNRSQPPSLPTKQKGFKPPLTRPPPPAPIPRSSPSLTPGHRKDMGSTRPGSVNVLVPSSEPSSGGTHQHQAVAVRQEDDATMRSSSPAPEADSSYGDMPFDMDALEETMKLYD